MQVPVKNFFIHLSGQDWLIAPFPAKIGRAERADEYNNLSAAQILQ